MLRKFFFDTWEIPQEPQVVIRRQTPMRAIAVLVALVLEDFGLPRTSNDWKWLKMRVNHSHTGGECTRAIWKVVYYWLNHLKYGLIRCLLEKVEEQNSLNFQSQTKKGLGTSQKFISFNVEWIWLLDFSPKISKSNKNNISSGKNGFSEFNWKFFMDFWKVYNLLSMIVWIF